MDSHCSKGVKLIIPNQTKICIYHIIIVDVVKCPNFLLNNEKHGRRGRGIPRTICKSSLDFRTANGPFIEGIRRRRISTKFSIIIQLY